jgi:hypothetical protein
MSDDFYVKKRLEEARKEVASKLKIIDAVETSRVLLTKCAKIINHLNSHKFTEISLSYYNSRISSNDELSIRIDGVSFYINMTTLENSLYSDYDQLIAKEKVKTSESNPVSVLHLEKIYAFLEKEFKSKIEKLIMIELIEKRLKDVINS